MRRIVLTIAAAGLLAGGCASKPPDDPGRRPGELVPVYYEPVEVANARRNQAVLAFLTIVLSTVATAAGAALMHR